MQYRQVTPPPKPERAEDTKQRDIHRITSLRVHQALIQSQHNNNNNNNNNNKQWQQPAQEEVRSHDNYIGHSDLLLVSNQIFGHTDLLSQVIMFVHQMVFMIDGDDYQQY